MEPVDPNAMLQILIVAFILETLVEFFFSWLLTGIFNLPGEVMRFVAAIAGVGLAFGFRLAVLDSLVGLQAIAPWIDYTVTGLVLARGSNLVHDLLGMVKAAKENLRGQS